MLPLDLPDRIVANGLARVGNRGHIVAGTTAILEDRSKPVIAVCGSIFFANHQGDLDELPVCSDCAASGLKYADVAAGEFERQARDVAVAIAEAD